MSSDSVQARLSLLIKSKMRETGFGVRAAAKDAQISAATLSRLERGISARLPDVGTLEKLAMWLGTSVGDLLGEKESKKAQKEHHASLPELVEVNLRADKDIAPETAKALAKMFKMLYEQAKK